MTFEEFKNNWKNKELPCIQRAEIRKGQSLINLLWDVWPKEYNRIISDNNLDCFYDDGKIDNLLNHLSGSWVKFPN